MSTETPPRPASRRDSNEHGFVKHKLTDSGTSHGHSEGTKRDGCVVRASESDYQLHSNVPVQISLDCAAQRQTKHFADEYRHLYRDEELRIRDLNRKAHRAGKRLDSAAMRSGDQTTEDSEQKRTTLSPVVSRDRGLTLDSTAIYNDLFVSHCW
eukprot:scaffold49147_cov46-Prasinocladus_malaysianus.AAC.1